MENQEDKITKNFKNLRIDVQKSPYVPQDMTCQCANYYNVDDQVRATVCLL